MLGSTEFRISRMRLQSKLIIAFFLMISLIFGAGGAGLFFIDEIRGNVQTLTGAASPLFENAILLVNSMQTSDHLLDEILSQKDPQIINEIKATIEKYKQEFDAGFNTIKGIIDKEEIQLDLNEVAEKKSKYFDLVPQIIALHESNKQYESQARTLFSTFEDQMKVVNKELIALINRAKAAMNEKEDKGKVMAMSENAAINEVADLFSELFSQDYYLVDGSESVRGYLQQLYETTKSFVSEIHPENLENVKKEFDGIDKKMNSRLKRLKSRLNTEENIQSYKIINEEIEKLKNIAESDNGLFNIYQKYLSSDISISELKRSMKLVADEFKYALEGVNKAAADLNQDSQAKTKTVVGKAKSGIVLLVIIGTIIGILSSFLIIKSVTKPIKQVMDLADELKNGNLSLSFSTGSDEFGMMGSALNVVVDELKHKSLIAKKIALGDLRHDLAVRSDNDVLGDALKTMIESLNSTVDELNLAAAQVDSGAYQVAESSLVLSDGATKQAASIEEISSSMANIGVKTKTNADNASQANKMASSSRNITQMGLTKVKEMLKAMESINQESNKIRTIIKTIDDIAFQTNLLALNAAVEAARAGKSGKGFAVVAEEVRTLASRSSKAAQETSALIEGSVKKVKDGTEIAEKTAEALEGINDSITKAAELIGDIASASSEQAVGIDQINQALDLIGGVIQQNTANAEETSAAAKELSDQAAYVRRLLAHFKLKKSRSSEIDTYEGDDYEYPLIDINDSGAQGLLSSEETKNQLYLTE